MEPYYQRYTIDQHLGRHLSSLRNLAKAGPEHFPLCLQIVKKNSLYHEAWEIFAEDKESLKKVIDLHADFLLSSDKNAEAGLCKLPLLLFTSFVYLFIYLFHKKCTVR